MSHADTRSILVVTSRFPSPAIGGDKLRILTIITHLSEHFDVDVVALYSSASALEGLPDLRRRCRSVYPIRLSRSRRFVGVARGIVTGRPMQVGLYQDPGIRARIDRLVAGNLYDAALAHLIRTVGYTDAMPADRVMVEMTDAISLNYDRIARPRRAQEVAYLAERSRVRRYEQHVIKASAATVVVSRTDADHLVAGGAEPDRVHVIGNGTDATPVATEPDPMLISMAGNMRSTQNEDMALWFNDDVLPLVRAEIPAARFVVIGANPSRRLRSRNRPPGTVIAGEVADMAAAVARSSVSVCPMRYGAGVQNKILEAMAIGVPVITTPFGLEGIDAEPGSEILVGADKHEFARQVVSALRDRDHRSALAAAGIAFIDRRFRWDEPMRQYRDLVDSVIERAAGSR